jgi:glycosyltransferase involved in cell wall biosynthesis
MRIGIVPRLKQSAGGIYQYSMTMLCTLAEWTTEGCEDEFVVFAQDDHDPRVEAFDSRSWTVKSLQPPPSRTPKYIDKLFLTFFNKRPHTNNSRSRDAYAVQFQSETNRWFHRSSIDLMLYPAPHKLSFETDLPYVMAIHDLQHRLQPEFPEVSADGEWERREYLFRNGSRYATLLLADSEIGKEDILNFYGPYGITQDRIKILPFLPASYVTADVPAMERQRVRTLYHLPERYLFYPAQFWPHKNHVRIVKALGLINQEHRLKIPVLFSGAYTTEIQKRTFEEVLSLSRQLGLENQVCYLNYVPDKDMSALYAEAGALVMPTFFGPTNIPVMEAWLLGCPVLTSDIRGVREQAGNAAILVDPRSVEAIAHGIYRLWTDKSLARALVEQGRSRLAIYSLKDYRQRLKDIMEEAKSRVRSEKQTVVRR